MTFKWETQQEKFLPKSSFGLIIWALLSLSLVFFALWQRNPLMFILFALVAATSYLYLQEPTQKLEITINKKGVQINDEFYSYNNLDSFWITFEPDTKKEISFRTKKALRHNLDIPLKKQDPLKLRKFLLKYLEEEERP